MTATIRPLEEGDLRFVVDSWWKSHAKATRSRRLPEQRSLILEALDRPETQVLVMAAEADPNHILGWLAYTWSEDIAVVHWCYVKRPYRRFQVCRRLLSEAGIESRTPVVITGGGRFADLLIQRHAGDVGQMPLGSYLGDARSAA